MSTSSSGPVTAHHPVAGPEHKPTVARPIVVGLREGQPELLDHAAELARALALPLRVVHAYWRNVGSADLYLGRDATQPVREAAQRVLDEARRRLDGRTSDEVDYALVLARPIEAVMAESEHAALLVLGTDHTGWFNRLTGREVTRHAALHARCPVVVVPSGVSTGAAEIVAAIDLDNVSQDALDLAVDLGTRLGAAVRVVHVVQAGLAGPALGHQRARLDETARHWRLTFPRADLRTEVVPADAISELTRITSDARLMVLGRPNEPRIAPAFSSPVAASLLRTARCPVVVVPAARRR